MATEPRQHAAMQPRERMVVLRSFRDAQTLIALLGAGHPVLAVLRTSDDERRRVLDLLAGWALGAGGDLDRIGPNTVLARPPGSEAVRLGRTSLTCAVEEVFAEGGIAPLGRDQEELLLRQAAEGSVPARRRLLDAYSDFATLFALRVRSASTSEATAVTAAQQELERLLTFPSKGPLLASLADGIIKLLLGDPPNRPLGHT